MTENMKKVLMGLGVVVIAALLWVALVTPAREDKDTAQAAQVAAEAKAAAVAGQLATAKEAAARTPQNRETLKRLAVAVPEKVEAPALIDQLNDAARRYDVSFDVLKVSNGAASAAPAAVAATTTPGTEAGKAADGSVVAGAPATGATGPAGSVPVELNVEISGRYTDVTKFLKSSQSEVRVRENGRVSAKGRLLRVTAVDLASDGEGRGRMLKGTLSVVAYLLPKDTGAASVATTAAPPAAGTTTAPATTGSQP